MAFPSNLERGKDKYCSLECRYSDSKLIIKNCLMCGKEFKVFPADIKRNKGKYCSTKCQSEASKNQIEKICQQCGKVFFSVPSKNAKFCSKKCSDLAKEKKVKCVCKNCKKEFEISINKAQSGKFCSQKCFFEYNRGENSSSWKGGISFEPYCPKFTEELKEKVRQEWDYKCGNCDKTQENNQSKLRVHHIDYDKEQGCNGKGFFLMPLCTSCHGKSNHNREYWKELCTLKCLRKEVLEIEILR